MAILPIYFTPHFGCCCGKSLAVESLAAARQQAFSKKIPDGGRTAPGEGLRLVAGCIKNGTLREIEVVNSTAFLNSDNRVFEVTTVFIKVFSGATDKNLPCSRQNGFCPVEDGNFISMATTSTRLFTFKNSRYRVPLVSR
ncbi:MAG: hypothetical protein A2021_05185 [Elusimicrobia bacterium GWF2_52_66]|nr:MAG: hypothetical protein A2021_05185 [Elusimicrobia bacterium GWF2_52_66]